MTNEARCTGGLVKHWENLRGRARWNMNLKCFWNTDEFLVFSRNVTGLTYWIRANVTLFSPWQMYFSSYGTPSLHSNNRCAACVHGKMSTHVELLGRFCTEDGAQMQDYQFHAQWELPSWIVPAVHTVSLLTESHPPLFSILVGPIRTVALSVQGGGGIKSRDWAWDVGRLGKWNEEGMEMTVRAAWRVRSRSCSANRGAGRQTDGFDWASRRTWRWWELQGEKWATVLWEGSRCGGRRRGIRGGDSSARLPLLAIPGATD